MYRSFPEKDQSTVPLLYHMFAKLELEDGKPDEALKILVSMADTNTFSKYANETPCDSIYLCRVFRREYATSDPNVDFKSKRGRLYSGAILQSIILTMSKYSSFPKN